MFRFRHTPLIRTLSLLLLLRVGLDLGAHGLFASDFEAIDPGTSAARFCAADDAPCAAPCLSHNHCICHGLSIGPVHPASLDVVSRPGQLVLALPQSNPHFDRYPLDRPPKHTA
jgi:hypothetical protein